MKKGKILVVICILFITNFQVVFGASIDKNQKSNSNLETLDFMGWDTDDLPSSFNWADVNGTDFTTPVKSQSPFASCETFAFVAAVETMVQIKVGYPFGCDLSEAHLFFHSDGNLEWGSYPENDANYLVEYGVPDEACWPYPKERKLWPKNMTCPNWMDRTVKITNWSYMPSGDINAIKAALVNNGPVPTYMNVYNDFKFYEGGVYRHLSGDPIAIHLVCIMGYKDDPKIPSGGYWIIKNSWGKKWGENGWFRIAYGEGSIEQMPVLFQGVYGQFPILYVDDNNVAGPWDGSEAYPYNTISEAIENAYNGWTVYVKNGTYTENLVINKTINIDGEAAQTTVINGDGSDVVVYICAPNIRISGFTIQNSGTNPLNSGIRTLSLYSNATIKNCILQNNDVGIYLNYAFEKSYNNVENNIIRNNRIGIYATWSYNNEILNNEIYQNTETGIKIEACQNCIIKHNNINNNTKKAVILQGGANNNLLQNNNFTYSSKGLEISESNDNKIKYNNFRVNDWHAHFIRSRGNRWYGNYWDEWIMIINVPRIIKGTINLLNLTWFNFDWRPSNQPI